MITMKGGGVVQIQIPTGRREHSMGSEDVIFTCGGCGVKNRIPRGRMGQRALCGKCRAPIVQAGSSVHPAVAGDGNFSTEVLESKLPVLVDFWAPWCGPCRAMSPIIDRLAANYAGTLKVVKVDVDQNPATASRYGIRSIPSLMFFKNGSVIDTVLGAHPPEELERRIQSIISW
jgi:thioredoxin 2